jgi:transcriptional regulator with XRE-family HTH domain
MAEHASPTLRRRQLAERLRRLRTAKSLTMEQVAERLLCSVTKISRIETGSRNVALRDVRDLSELYGVEPAERDSLMALARDSKEQAWWQGFDISTEYEVFVELEQAAVSISEFSNQVVPGLLQTPEYALAAELSASPKPSPSQAARRVELRRARQGRLRDRRDQPDVPGPVPGPIPELWIVLDETALTRPVGGHAVMADQVQQLIDLGEDPKINIQMLPMENGAHGGLNSFFTILKLDSPTMSDVVYLDGLHGQFYMEGERDLDRYRRFFDDLRSDALGFRDTRTHMHDIAARHREAGPGRRVDPN